MLTQIGTITFLVLLTAAFAHAKDGNLDAREDAMAKAYNDYFNAVLKSKPSPQGLQNLKSEIVEPALKDLRDYVQDRQVSAIKRNFKLIDEGKASLMRRQAQEEAAAEKDISSDDEKKMEAIDKSLSNPAKKKPTGGLARSETEREQRRSESADQLAPLNPREDVVIDGSNVPKEIEFKRYSKEDPRHRLQVEQNERGYIKPSNAGDGVDEMSFPGARRPASDSIKTIPTLKPFPQKKSN